MKYDKRYISNLLKLNIFKDESDFVVTGATGVIGSELIKLLIYIRSYSSRNFKIYGLCRSQEKLNTLVDGDVIFVKYDMDAPIHLDVKNPIIIHLASPTSTQMFLKQPTLVQTLITKSTNYISDFALKTNARKLISLSTMEVYGEQPENILIKEDQFFGLDPSNTRNSYPLAKMMMENYLMGAALESNLPVTILRLTQVMAPPIDVNDNRVIFYFSKNAIMNQDIELKTSGQTFRSYIYYLDVLSAILVAANERNHKKIYNVSTPNSCISIVELAEKIIKVANSSSKITYNFTNNDETGFRDSLGLCIDSSKIEAIGWIPMYSLEASLEFLINDVKKVNQI